MIHASSGPNTSFFPGRSPVGGDHSPRWYPSVARWLWWGLAIRLILAPLTSMEADVSVWWNVVHHTTQGVGLYDIRLFSYPPVYGYWLQLVGGVLHLFGGGAGALGTSYATGASATAATYGTVMPTVLGALVFKIPMILADVGTGWTLWRIALRLGASEDVARRSFAWWFLNPVVVWVGSVHGQIDSLAAFGIALTVLALLSEQWVLAGAALSFGVAVKLSPIFLAPMVVGYLLAPSRRRSARVWGGVVGGALASALLFVGPELSGRMLSGVLSRTAQVGPVGGLEWTGIARSLPVLSGVYTRIAHHFVSATRVSNWLQIIAALGGGVATWRRSSPSRLLATSGVVMAVIVSVNLVANPEFTLWFLPFVALVAGGVWSSPRSARVATGLMAGGVLIFYGSLFAPAYYFGVLGAWTGYPGPASVASESAFLARGGAHFFLWPAANWMRLDLVASVLVTLGTVLVVREFLRIDSRAVDVVGSSRPVSRRMGVLVVGVSVALVTLGWVAPKLVSTPTPTLVTTSATPSSVTIHTTPSAGTVVSVFRVDPSRSVSRVVFFSDPTYPYVSSDAGTILGTEQQVASSFAQSHVSTPVSLVDARTLTSLLPHLSTRALLVDLTGVMPTSVVDSRVLQQWIRAGGRLVFGGYLPGVYASSSAPELGIQQVRQAAGHPAWPILPRGLTSGYYPHESWATRVSPWARALNIFYPEVMFGVRESRLRHLGGVSYGNSNGTDATLAWVPVGRGGLLVVAGSDLGEYEVDLGVALTRLVATNALAAQGLPRSASASSGKVTLPVPAGSSPLEIVVTDANRPLWVWARIVSSLGVAS